LSEVADLLFVQLGDGRRPALIHQLGELTPLPSGRRDPLLESATGQATEFVGESARIVRGQLAEWQVTVLDVDLSLEGPLVLFVTHGRSISLLRMRERFRPRPVTHAQASPAQPS